MRRVLSFSHLRTDTSLRLVTPCFHGEWAPLCASFSTSNHGRKEGSMRLIPTSNHGRMEGSMRLILPSTMEEWRALCASYYSQPWENGGLYAPHTQPNTGRWRALCASYPTVYHRWCIPGYASHVPQVVYTRVYASHVH